MMLINHPTGKRGRSSLLPTAPPFSTKTNRRLSSTGYRGNAVDFDSKAEREIPQALHLHLPMIGIIIISAANYRKKCTHMVALMTPTSILFSMWRYKLYDTMTLGASPCTWLQHKHGSLADVIQQLRTRRRICVRAAGMRGAVSRGRTHRVG